MVQVTTVTKGSAEKAKELPQTPQAKLHVVKLDEDTQKSQKAIQSSSLEEADTFWEQHYFHPVAAKDNLIIPPPYNPVALRRFIQHNNALNQCIAALEVNIAGTGYEIESRDPDRKEALEEQGKEVLKFFEEVFPCISFTTVKRALRRDQEELGNSYLEIMRNLKGDITFLRNADSANIRMVRLDDPVAVEVEMERFGKKETITTLKRERRYAQLIGKRILYFKEFGSSREVHRKTGKWESKENPVLPQDRGSELIHMYPLKDADSPYGIPRWINQLPSVLGSRKAEEFNLTFFDCGGLPPALITIAGGTMSEVTRKTLEAYMSGKGGNKHRAAILEAYSSTGSLDAAGTVKVEVERFGNERADDSMFEGYDEKCADRIRSAFRLPPILVGKASDYTLATAFASYLVAEAQVFKPEREEDDQIINTKIMRELAPDFVIRSTAIQVKDMTQQLRALQMGRQSLDHDEFVKQLNETASLNMTVSSELEGEAIQPKMDPAQLQSIAAGGKGPAPGTPKGAPPAKGPVKQGTPIATQKTIVTGHDPSDLIHMAQVWAEQITTVEQDQTIINHIHTTVEQLDEIGQHMFAEYVTANLMSVQGYDPAGAVELMSAANTVLGCNHA